MALPEQVASILERSEEIKLVAEHMKDCQHGFFLGRGLDYSIATEASLKMKEVSYMHTEAFASGELKHGTIALIEQDIPVIAITTQTDLFEKSVSNIKEVRKLVSALLPLRHIFRIAPPSLLRLGGRISL